MNVENMQTNNIIFVLRILVELFYAVSELQIWFTSNSCSLVAERTIMNYLYDVLLTLSRAMVCVLFWRMVSCWRVIAVAEGGNCVGGSRFACCLSASVNPEVASMQVHDSPMCDRSHWRWGAAEWVSSVNSFSKMAAEVVQCWELAC